VFREIFKSNSCHSPLTSTPKDMHYLSPAFDDPWADGDGYLELLPGFQTIRCFESGSSQPEVNGRADLQSGINIGEIDSRPRRLHSWVGSSFPHNPTSLSASSSLPATLSCLFSR
jgi:hypothetical protein